jgi:anti-sigma-K factor RskA
MIDRSDIAGLAAEYVIGTLDKDERKEVFVARSSSDELDGAIRAWEKRLEPLLALIPEAIPSADVFSKIERRLFVLPTDRAVLLRNTNRWRAMALAASLAFVIVSGIALHNAFGPMTSLQTVAFLEKDAAAPAFLVSLDEKTLALTVRPLVAAPAADKSYELWLIAPGSPAPRSLGVLPTKDSKLVQIADIDLPTLRNATLAVSLEPHGGSPTGAPTGPVVFTGKFVQAKL